MQKKGLTDGRFKIFHIHTRFRGEKILMAYNMDMNKGLYPDEPGYNDWPSFKLP